MEYSILLFCVALTNAEYMMTAIAATEGRHNGSPFCGGNLSVYQRLFILLTYIVLSMSSGRGRSAHSTFRMAAGAYDESQLF